MNAQKMDELIKFVEERCEAGEILTITNVAKEFKDRTKDRSEGAVTVDVGRKWIREYKEKVPKIQNEGKRAKQLFALSVPVKKDLLNKLKRHAEVKLDSAGRIVEYISKDGTLTLKGDQSHRAKLTTAKRNVELTMAAVKKEELPDSDNDLGNPPSPKRSRNESSTRRLVQSPLMTPPRGVSPSASGVSTQMHLRSPSDELLEAKQKISELEQKMKLMKNGIDQSNLQKKKADEEFEKEREKWQDEKKELIQKNSKLLQKNTSLAQKQARHAQEMLEIKEEMEQADAKHQEEVEQLKRGAVQDLKKKSQTLEEKLAEVEDLYQNEMKLSDRLQKDQENLHKEKEAKLLEEKANLQKQIDQVAASYEAVIRMKEETAEIHRKEMEHMRKKIEESAGLQNDQEKQHKEKEAELQKKIDELLVERKTVACFFSGLVNEDGDAPSTSNIVEGTFEQLKVVITEEAKSD